MVCGGGGSSNGHHFLCAQINTLSDKSTGWPAAGWTGRTSLRWWCFEMKILKAIPKIFIYFANLHFPISFIMPDVHFHRQDNRPTPSPADGPPGSLFRTKGILLIFLSDPIFISHRISLHKASWQLINNKLTLYCYSLKNTRNGKRNSNKRFIF